MATQTVGFPLEVDDLMSTLVHLLAERGHTRAIAILAASRPDLDETGYDNWNGGSTFWTLTLRLPPSLYGQIATPDRHAAEKTIADSARECMRGMTGDSITKVCISPMIVKSDDWRAEAMTWLRGDGINNQGRVRSDNIASREYDGLLFRSHAEIRLYRALKAKGVSFAPLPVFVRGGQSYRRIEPDFVVIKDGTMMAVEVDGDTVHQETPVEAHDRTTMLAHEGVHIERVSAQECATDEAARLCADRLLLILAKYAGSR